LLWQRDGEATVHHPPNSLAFDPALRRTSIIPQRQAHIDAAVSSTSQDGVAVLSQVVKDLVETLVIKKPQSVTDKAPMTPKWTLHAGLENSSPLPPSPSHLGKFLTHADEKLGVRDAMVYLSPMSRKGYGPDILADVPVSDLTDPSIGLTPGDAIRLKRGSVDWWSEESKKTFKRPRARTILSNLPAHTPFTPDNEGEQSRVNAHDNSISYRIEYPDGGGKRWFAGPLLHGRQRENDDITEYFDEARKQWVRIPLGFTVPLEPGEEIDPFDEF